ncbi:unnamed protein product [Leptidea sinapis]|uniref:Uncharacterized protein n=1 Tax=Leptidea sinapis TaxID=189913 RepID=A0A5E4PP73_9NEOP|nr:unnamed protein product [Leptidea sinapis]
MYRGYSYVEASEYQRGIDLWTWALQLRSTRHTLLYAGEGPTGQLTNSAAWRARRTCRVTVTCCACSTCWLTSCLVSTPP